MVIALTPNKGFFFQNISPPPKPSPFKGGWKGVGGLSIVTVFMKYTTTYCHKVLYSKVRKRILLYYQVELSVLTILRSDFKKVLFKNLVNL